jgi:hypothetical protein
MQNALSLHIYKSPVMPLPISARQLGRMGDTACSIITSPFLSLVVK